MIVSGARSFIARADEAGTRSARKTFAGGIDEDLFSSAEQARPLPLAYGQFRLGAAFVSPIWNDRAVEIDGGKKVPGGALGYDYFGYYAVAFCHGPLTRIREFQVSDKPIWTGPLTRSPANENGVILTTELGTAVWYWGTDTQAADPTLQTLHPDQPGYRGTAMLVLLDFRFGRAQTPPQITLVAERELSLLSISQHSLSGDAVLPEVYYDILTHPRYGCRQPADKIDKAAFEAAAEILIDEDLGASPVWRDPSNLREGVGKLLTYMRAVSHYNGGKVTLKLLRDDPAETPVDVTVDDLLDPPEPEPGDWAATWAQTRVTFTDAANNWERAVAAYTDPANARVRGYIVPQDIEREWFTRSAVAKREAARLGTLNGLPLANYPGLRLKPSFRAVRPGQLLRLSYPKLNIAAAWLRAERVSVGGPDDPVVTVDAIEDPARQTTLGHVPAGVATGQPGYTRPPLVAPSVRIATLAPDLKQGAADGLLVAVSRPTGLTVRHETFFTWNPSLASFGRLALGTAFPILGTIVWWLRSGPGWILRFKVAGSFDALAMAGIAESFQDYYIAAGRRVVVTSPASDVHKLLCVLARRKLGGRFAAITADTFDIEVEAGQLGTTGLALETSGAGASSPTGTAYLGLLGSFVILRSDTLAFDRNQGNDPADTALRRYIKTIVGDEHAMLELGDVPTVEFRRLDGSMDPAGSYVPTWGNRAKTAYELLDDQAGLQLAGTPGSDYDYIIDLDDALGRVLEGTATPDDTALLSDLDDVLGAVLERGDGIYNDAP